MTIVLLRLIFFTAVGLSLSLPALFLLARTQWRRQRQKKEQSREAELLAHKETLQNRIDNLLLACERLLDGATPEQSLLYQVVDGYGGTADPIRELRVNEWIRRSQLALHNSFAMRRHLLDAELQEQRPLSEQIADWELLYITLVGSRDRVLNLNDEELRILLDPFEVLERYEPDDAALANQLHRLHDQLQNRPLKVDLRVVDPAQLDGQGILGYVDLVEEELARLQLEAAARERLRPDNTASSFRGSEQSASALLGHEGRRARLGHQPAAPTNAWGRKLTISERLASMRGESEAANDEI